LAAAFLAAAFFAVAFLAAVFLAAAFLAVVFLAGAFLAAAFFLAPRLGRVVGPASRRACSRSAARSISAKFQDIVVFW
jgi:hypothetical protein